MTRLEELRQRCDREKRVRNHWRSNGGIVGVDCDDLRALLDVAEAARTFDYACTEDDKECCEGYHDDLPGCEKCSVADLHAAITPLVKGEYEEASHE